jgi:flavodoxin I
MSIGIFYTTSTGNNDDIAEKIGSSLGDIEIFNLINTSLDKINEFDKVILGVSTWGDGELNDDFEDIWDDFKEIDFSNKTVALFGLGDQEGYEDTFCDALGSLYEQVISSGAKVVGFTSTDTYDFQESKAVIDGKFVGLALDEDNQDDLTDDRIKTWVESIKADIL